MTDGCAEIGFARRGGATRLVHLYQRDPLRVLFPTPEPGDPIQAVVVTTSGGLVAGDTIEIAVDVAAAASAHVTASAAEKIYRSPSPGEGGATTAVRQSLTVGDRAVLEYLPPETILFDGARLQRETLVALSPEAAFLGGEIIVFGRRARGERFTHGLLHAVWEVRRDNQLIWGDALHLDGDIGGIVDEPACFDGAAGFATLILASAAGNLGNLLDDARAVQSQSVGDAIRGGISIVNGLVIARWLGFDALLMRRAFSDLARHLREQALNFPRRLPRLWHV